MPGTQNFDGERLVNLGPPKNAEDAATKDYVDKVGAQVQTSGALTTQQLVSATAAQISTARDTNTATSVTYDNSSGDATIKVELSPDNSTFSTLATITFKTFTGAVSGNITMVNLRVPAGWYVKLTTTNATLGLTSKF